ncbi:glycerol kinase GlpK [Roseiconus nitratireducens]|uniref:Glycerol kinase n=1 Tax=Roseiconus nitratireducens TaxID=2605748 RepID=A0A5M6D687_9BACT|nr:glycerol kinase GlpK [Roseiconus nitratireducens]KAA5543028.1 glycerol kinase GlpK [Roseiconus nitratireducens]
MGVVLALDQGTTSSRAILFDHAGSVVGVAQQEFEQHYPRPGWVEHDADEIWNSQHAVAVEVLAKCDCKASDVEAIGITNQRETTLLWDRTTGQPIHPAIVWQDRRTAGYCDSLVAAGHGQQVRDTTGLLIDPYFCATKIHWLLENVPGARARAERGELAFGTIDSWLIWKLTGGRVHVTDVTNASRTMLLNLRTCQWDESLLDLLSIPAALLPEIVESSEVYGETDAQWFGETIKIGGAAGDQQAALFGQNCTRHGMAKNTYGTGCFMLMNVGEQPQRSENKLLTSVACSAAGRREYALEGSVFVAGAAVQWLRDGLGIIESSSDVESLARSVPDSDGVYLVPAFAGLGAPHWDAYARGTLVGLTRGTHRGHIARATLEGIAFQVADVFDAMQKDTGMNIAELRVDGGASANDLLMQFQADIMKTPVVRPKVIETTALGAAYLAGLAVGFWKDIHEIESIWEAEKVFTPSLSESEVEHRRSRWAEALHRAQAWETEA